jgi:DNA-binding transcriptional ArsR family regulator
MMSDDKVLEILKVISHPSRVEILRRIKARGTDGSATCSSVLEGMEISQSTFSHHISELCDAGLILANNQGRFVYLSVDDQVWEEFQSSLGKAVFG